MKSITKLYKKLIIASTEYQAFRIYERLSDEEQKLLERVCLENGKMFLFFRHIHTHEVNLTLKSS
ncbi:hypothetical protein ACWE42_20680 [Sutcliffiella cohnii]